MSSSPKSDASSEEISLMDKRMITKMLSDAAVPPQIISEVTGNVPLSRQLLVIIDEAKKSGKPAGAGTWAKVEAALAEHGIKRQRVDLGMAGGGEPGPVVVNAEEEKLIREYLGGGGAPDSLIREVLGKRELADGMLGMLRKAQRLQKK